MDKRLLMYCGLYCGDCIRYKSRFSDLSRELEGSLKEVDFAKYAEVKSRSVRELQPYEAFVSFLSALTKLQCTTPCRDRNDQETPFPCEIRDCCRDKGYQGCWECDGMETCRAFGFLEPFHGESPKKNLEKVRKWGLQEGIRLREKCYRWQEQTECQGDDG